MELTKGEFCRFNLKMRIELLKAFGEHVLNRIERKKMISIYSVFGFYVEVYENLADRKYEKCEPIKKDLVEVYRMLS